MREIKFRVWDDEFGALQYSDSAAGDGHEKVAHLLDCYFGRELEQYTGMNDNSGKNIYEGDIVRFKTPKGETLTADVVWSTGSHGFVFRGQSYYVVVFSTLEIIGNIHE